ncbi:MAG TPA: efflux transporter periplasmic adaptor subunit [Gammaproteobacteria bacterium]|nr:efflux transporter periplasmic adaptor subunit [Gammaproteobacteria bacterium]
MLKIRVVLMTSCLCLPVWAAETDPPATPGTDAVTVEIAPTLLRQLRIESVGEGEVSEILRFPARVELNDHQVARIGATVTGRISGINAVLGQSVEKGALLATLHSTELGEAKADYLKALSQVNLHRLAVERGRRLLEADVIGSAEVLVRESELVEVQIGQNAAADRLRVLGMSNDDIQKLDRTHNIHSVSPISATLAGTVIARAVTLGQVVQPADTLFTVADLSHVWVVAEVPEKEAWLVRKGEEAEVEIPALRGGPVRGPLIYVADVVNPETRTVTVRMDVANPNREIKPAMLATMLIRQEGSQHLVVPAEAVVRDNDRDHVFVQIEPQRFELRPVELAPGGDERVRVLRGLKRGEPLVVEGAFHLNNERLRTALE